MSMVHHLGLVELFKTVCIGKMTKRGRIAFARIADVRSINSDHMEKLKKVLRRCTVPLVSVR